MFEKAPSRLYYGWIIVLVLGISMMLAYATRSSFTVFYAAILDEFGWTRADTAGIFSVGLVIYGVGGVMVGFLLDRLGPRRVFPIAAGIIMLGAVLSSQATEIWHLYLTFGLLVSFGQCAMGYVPTMTVINHWFVRRRGLALGIVLFLFSLSFLFSPLTQYLRETVGWRTAFLIFAAAILVVVVPTTSFLLRRRPQDMRLLADGDKEAGDSEARKRQRSDAAIVDARWAAQEWTLPRALRTRRMWFIFGAAMTMGITFNFPMVHQVTFMTDVGYTAMFAALVYSIFGLLNGMAPLSGFISDRIGREMSFTLGAAGIATGAAIAFSIRGPGLEWAWYLSAIAYGAGYSLISPTQAATYGDMFLGKNLGSIIGFGNMGFGLGGALGPFLAGYIHDTTGSYNLAFIMVIAAAFCGMILIWLAAPRKVRLVAGRASKKALQGAVEIEAKEKY